MPRSQTAESVHSNRYTYIECIWVWSNAAGSAGDAWNGTVSTRHADKVILVAGFTCDCIDSATKCQPKRNEYVEHSRGDEEIVSEREREHRLCV